MQLRGQGIMTKCYSSSVRLLWRGECDGPFPCEESGWDALTTFEIVHCTSCSLLTAPLQLFWNTFSDTISRNTNPLDSIFKVSFLRTQSKTRNFLWTTIRIHTLTSPRLCAYNHNGTRRISFYLYVRATFCAYIVGWVFFLYRMYSAHDKR